MRKNVFGRKLKRDTKERKALFKGLITSLVLHERIHTTQQKAKAIKGDVDRLITKTKNGGVNARKAAEQYIHSHAIDKLLQDVAPRFVNRQGGYSRIIRLGRRFNDNASMVIIEWVEKPVKVPARNASHSDAGGEKLKKETKKSLETKKTPAKRAVKKTKETKKK